MEPGKDGPAKDDVVGHEFQNTIGSVFIVAGQKGGQEVDANDNRNDGQLLHQINYKWETLQLTLLLLMLKGNPEQFIG